MAYYYINSQAQTTGEHELHTTGCPTPPAPAHQLGIGYYNNCSEAIYAARRRFPNDSIDGCYWCCRGCHSR